MNATFGDFVKVRRTEKRIGLRAFSAALNVDPANFSKIERGKLPPPRDSVTLDRYRRALGIDENSPEHNEMVRLAALDRGEVPPKLLSDKELAGKLPVFFRTLEGDPVDEALLDELIATIRREH